MSGADLMHPTSRMEQLSLAYIKAVASFCGYNSGKAEVDDDSIDLTISSSAGRKAKLDLQLKASGVIDSTGESFSFSLSIKNYNDLRADSLAPRILVVLCMPPEQTQWIDHSVDQLMIKKCAYWVSLKNQPETQNTTSINVTVPTGNLVSPDGLHSLMQKIERGEDI